MGPLLQHTCTINRSVVVGTNGRSQMEALYTDVSCLVLPMAPQVAVEHNFSLGLGYDIYFGAGQDIKTGDQVIFNGDTYVVKNTMPYQVSIVGHVRALCEKEIP